MADGSERLSPESLTLLATLALPVVRRAFYDDAQTLTRIRLATFFETFSQRYSAEDLATYVTTTLSAENTAKLLLNADRHVQLMSCGERTIGFVSCGPCKLPGVPEARAGEVYQLYLLREFQGKGHGSYLLELATEWLKHSGFSSIYIGVFSENSGAIRLYERFGFVKVGEYDLRIGAHTDVEYVMRLK